MNCNGCTDIGERMDVVMCAVQGPARKFNEFKIILTVPECSLSHTGTLVTYTLGEMSQLYWMIKWNCVP